MGVVFGVMTCRACRSGGRGKKKRHIIRDIDGKVTMLACVHEILKYAHEMKESGAFKSVDEAEEKYMAKSAEKYSERIFKPLEETFRSSDWKPGARMAKMKFRTLLHAEMQPAAMKPLQVASLVLESYKSDHEEMEPKLSKLKVLAEKEKEEYVAKLTAMRRQLRRAKELDWSKEKVESIEEVIAHIPAKAKFDIPNAVPG